MNVYTFTINGHLTEQCTGELDALGLRYSGTPGCSYPEFAGRTTTGYYDGLRPGASVQHTVIQVALPPGSVSRFEKLKDLPICSAELTVIPCRYMALQNDLWYSPEHFDEQNSYLLTVLKELDRLAYVYRRHGDRVRVPVQQVYNAAKSLGEFVPKHQPDSTADRVQDLCYGMGVTCIQYPDHPIPAVNGNSEFDQARKMILSWDYCSPGDIPLICTLLIPEKSKPRESEFIGELKKRQQMTLTPVALSRGFPSDYGDRYEMKLTDPEGNKVVWWTGEKAKEFQIGRPYLVKATPVKHDSESGEKVTYVNRVAEITVE